VVRGVRVDGDLVDHPRATRFVAERQAASVRWLKVEEWLDRTTSATV
jgi:hypothetical protein